MDKEGKMKGKMKDRMDSTLNNDTDGLFKRMGTSFDAATRIFAKQSVKFCLFPFTIKTKKSNNKGLGIAKGKLSLPDDFDDCNNEIENMFSLSHVRSLKDCE